MRINKSIYIYLYEINMCEFIKLFCAYIYILLCVFLFFSSFFHFFHTNSTPHCSCSFDCNLRLFDWDVGQTNKKNNTTESRNKTKQQIQNDNQKQNKTTKKIIYK